MLSHDFERFRSRTTVCVVGFRRLRYWNRNSDLRTVGDPASKALSGFVSSRSVRLQLCSLPNVRRLFPLVSVDYRS